MTANQDYQEEKFSSRHIGPNQEDTHQMLSFIGAKSLQELISETIPESIRLNKKLNLPPALSEASFLKNFKEISQKNQIFRSYLGMGYYNCHTPGVILRNILENPGWYTQYTPYQSEISQGRLEALLNFQTMVMDLTGMSVANASLLDEGTAAAEAMFMSWNASHRKPNKKNANVFFVSEQTYPQTIEILMTRAAPLGIEIKVGEEVDFTPDENVFGGLIQYPNNKGNIPELFSFIEKFHSVDGLVTVAADLLSLCLLTPPGELGADVVVGTTQRFGVPMGFGGPHAAYFATKDEYKRIIPGRIIGVSKDSRGQKALRMALQTREQHIRREKATSNICTAQVLLSIMASMYAVYHGPKGIKKIAYRIHGLTSLLSEKLEQNGFTQTNQSFFDTLFIQLSENNLKDLESIQERAEDLKINLRYFEEESGIGISLDEATTPSDIQDILKVITGKTIALGKTLGQSRLSEKHQRSTEFMTHPVFNSHHSETEMLRYIKSLEVKDLSLNISMIPLGSCTMKLNATSEMIPVTWAEVGSIHPFAPQNQTEGYSELINKLEDALIEITGFTGVSLQPNAGAQGEYAGLLVIRAYHKQNKNNDRNVILIPSSAHGTNPASAALAGMDIKVVTCDKKGNIDVSDLKTKAEALKDVLAGLMITYPSTHGVFEESIQNICQIIHDNGGLVYMDGANMNAQVGLTHPGIIGADVCHLNLHKTFCIPHGGGGPGMGPICVNDKLKPYLPSHSVVSTGGDFPINAVSAAPWGSASILAISYAYIAMMGEEGLTQSTEIAILNANYMLNKLKGHYPILYSGKNGRVAHEFIVDFRPLKQQSGIDVTDVAKRLMDYGFHAPTVSFPVPGTMMIEPTESESRHELDRFCDALLSIKNEIQDIIEGLADRENNVLKNAPHTQDMIASETWEHPYTREQAVFPTQSVRENKFWPPVGRVDNTQGDKQLICSCPPVENYQESPTVKSNV